MCTTEPGGSALHNSVNDNDAGDDTFDKPMYQATPKKPIAESASNPERNTEDRRSKSDKLEPDTAKNSNQLRLRTSNKIKKDKSTENELSRVYSRSMNFKLDKKHLEIDKGSDQSIEGLPAAVPELSSRTMKRSKNDPESIRAKLERRKMRQEKIHATKLVSEGEKSDSALQKSVGPAKRIKKESEAKNNDKLEDLKKSPKVKDNRKHVESDKNKKSEKSKKSDEPISNANLAGEDRKQENTTVKDPATATKNADVKLKKGKKLRNVEENKKSSKIAQKDPKIAENIRTSDVNGANSINRVSLTVETNYRSIEAALENANNPEGIDIKCADDAPIDDVDAAKHDIALPTVTSPENTSKDSEYTQENAKKQQPDDAEQIEAIKKVKIKKAKKSNAEVNRSVPEEGDRMKEQNMKQRDLKTSSKDAKNKDPKESGDSSKNRAAKNKSKITKTKVLESTSGECAPPETNVTKNDSDLKSGDAPTTPKPSGTDQMYIPSNEIASRDAKSSIDLNNADTELDKKTLEIGIAKEASSSAKYARLSRSMSLDWNEKREGTNTGGATTINSIGSTVGHSAGKLDSSEQAKDKFKFVNGKHRPKDAIVLQPLSKLAESSKGEKKQRKQAIDSKSSRLGDNSRRRYVDDSSLDERKLNKRAISTNDLSKYNNAAKNTGHESDSKKTALRSQDFDLTEAISEAFNSGASEDGRRNRRNSREKKNSLIFWRKTINSSKSEKSAEIITSNMAVMSPNTLVTPVGFVFDGESGDIPDTGNPNCELDPKSKNNNNKEDSNNSTGKTKGVSNKKASIFGRLFSNNLANKKSKGNELLEAIYGTTDFKILEMIIKGDDVLLNSSEMRQNRTKQLCKSSPTMSHSYSSDQLDSPINSGRNLHSTTQPKSQRIKFDTNATMLQILKEGNPITLSRYIKSIDYDVNAPMPEKSGKTALHLAVKWGKLSSAVTLLSRGADPNRLDHSMCTPLIYAANEGYIEMGKVLLTAGASAIIPNSNGEYPHELVKTDAKFAQILRAEFDKQIAKEKSSKETERIDENQLLKYLEKIREKCAPNPVTKEMLYLNKIYIPNTVAYNNKLRAMQYLIKELKFDPNDCDNSQHTPLHVACDKGDLEMILMLLKAKAKTQVVAKFGELPVDLLPYNIKIDLLDFHTDKRPAIVGKTGDQFNVSYSKLLEYVKYKVGS